MVAEGALSPQLGAFVLQVRLFLGAAEAAFEVGDPGDELESGHRLVEAHAIAKARTTARVITSAAVTPRRSFVYRPGRAQRDVLQRVRESSGEHFSQNASDIP